MDDDDDDERELLRQRIEELERQAAEARQLQTGTYYSSLLQVWAPSPRNIEEHCTEDRFHKLFRKTVPEEASYYRQIVDGATDTANVAALQWSRSSMKSDKMDEVWPTDIFGSDKPSAEIAHLIPASENHATMYGDVAGWVLAFTPPHLGNNSGAYCAMLTQDIWDLNQRAIHGAKRQEAGSHRIDYTGLKHCPSNKIRLKDHKLYFDNHPCLLIVPAMKLVDVLNWDGKSGYDALVLAEAWVAPVSKRCYSIEHVCTDIGMNKKGPVAEPEMIELARELLESVIYGLGYSLLHRDRPPLEPEYEKLFLDHKAPFDIMGTINVPTMAQGDQHPYVPHPRVRKIRLGPPARHPPPDPLLLTVKAAVVWSKRHGQALLAGGGEQDDVDNMDSLSQQALDDYLDWLRDDNMKPKSMEELAAGLGQPHGYYASLMGAE